MSESLLVRAAAEEAVLRPQHHRKRKKQRNRTSREDAKRAKRASRPAVKLQLQADLVAALEDIPDGNGERGVFQHLADRLRDCHSDFSTYVCENGHEWVQSLGRCNLRICPWCASARAVRQMNRFAPLLEHFRKSRRTRFVTLNETNFALGELAKGYHLLIEHFKVLRDLPGFECFRDALVVIGVTYRGDQKGPDLAWNVHLHLLVESGHIHQPKGVAAWQKATGGCGRTFDIRRFWSRDGAQEVFKYAVRMDKLKCDPEALREFIVSTRYRHLVRVYGLYRFNDLFPKGENPEVEIICPDCGSTVVKLVRDGLGRSDVFLDDAGILRPICRGP